MLCASQGQKFIKLCWHARSQPVAELGLASPFPFPTPAVPFENGDGPFHNLGYIHIITPHGNGRALGMVTPDEMRLFALECLRWSEEAEDASQRDLMIRVAKN